MKTMFFTYVNQRWAWTGSGLEPGFGHIGAGLGFSVGPDQSRIVMSRNCQLKYAVLYVWTQVSSVNARLYY